MSPKGTPPIKSEDAGISLLSGNADLTKTPLAVLEAEIERLEKLVAADKETSRKITAITKRLTEETASLERLQEKLVDFRGARARADALVAEREQGYSRVFEALLAEERVLSELYAPVRKRLEDAGGGTVKLTRRGRDNPSLARFSSSFNRHTSPLPTRGTSVFPVNDGDSEQMASHPEQIQHDAATRSTGSLTGCASLRSRNG